MRLSYRYNGRMRQALKVHPDSLCSAVTHIAVEIIPPEERRKRAERDRAGVLALSRSLMEIQRLKERKN